jgi:predicted transcriptional regulator
MATSPNLGRAELQILQHVTDHPHATVGEVARHFAVTTGLARTTVLTVMERLRRKGYLSRRRKGGVYQYFPRLSKANLLRNLVRDFVEGTLGGSLEPFMAYLAQNAEVSPEQLGELRRLVHDLDQQRKEGER